MRLTITSTPRYAADPADPGAAPAAYSSDHAVDSVIIKFVSMSQLAAAKVFELVQVSNLYNCADNISVDALCLLKVPCDKCLKKRPIVTRAHVPRHRRRLASSR